MPKMVTSEGLVLYLWSSGSLDSGKQARLTSLIATKSPSQSCVVIPSGRGRQSSCTEKSYPEQGECGEQRQPIPQQQSGNAGSSREVFFQWCRITRAEHAAPALPSCSLQSTMGEKTNYHRDKPMPRVLCKAASCLLGVPSKLWRGARLPSQLSLP